MLSKYPKALLAIFVASVFVGCLRTLDDPDIWFQLLAGRYALNNMAVPHNDFFLYAGANRPQIFGGWGFGAIYELIIRAFGLSWASVANAVIWTSSLVLPIATACRRRGTTLGGLSGSQTLMSMICVSILFFGVSTRMGLRAECTLFLAWQGAAYLDARFHDSAERWKFLLVMPLIVWTVAILHTGAFLLILFYLISIIGSWQAIKIDRKLVLFYGLSLGLAVILPLVNPNGYSQFLVQPAAIISGFSASSQTQSQTDIASLLISEYQPIWGSRMEGLYLNFGLVALLGLITLWSSWRPNGASHVAHVNSTQWRRSMEIILFAGFFLMSCMHIRGLALAAMVIAPIACEIFQNQDVPKLSASDSFLGKMILGLAFLFPMLAGMVQPAFGIEPSSNKIQPLANAIRQASPAGANIFTTEKGPALLYALNDEKFKVSFSSHFLLPNEEAQMHESRALFASEGWKDELSKWNVRYICVPFYLTAPGEGVSYKLPQHLAVDDEWRLVMVSPICPLFSRLAKDQVLTKQEREEKLLAYWGYMSLFELPSGPIPDKLGMRLGREAHKKLLENFPDRISR